MQNLDKELIEYFNGDELAAKVWKSKYALKDSDGYIYEKTPLDMHWRMAKEIARIEKKYDNPLTEEELFNLFDKFKYIIPQGSPMTGIGNDFQVASLSNCFVIGVEGDADSYGAIIRIDEEQVQLMKRRGGVGHDLSHIRPKGSAVKNSALTSTGLVPFMERYSNSTREVAQDGRRGALMLSVSVRHPDSEDFIDAKMEQGKVTGANVSVKIDDAFMRAVEADELYTQQYPINAEEPKFFKEIKAKELWSKIVNNAWQSAEPGVLFWDTIIKESVPDCYDDLGFNTVSTNPCGEIPLCPYDSCRLLAVNLYSYVINPFTSDAYFDFELFEKHIRIAQRIMDDIIDLEAEKIDLILDKINQDPETEEVKSTERYLWEKIKKKTLQGRRTGLGITAEGDMVAAMGFRYGTDEAIYFSEEVHKRLALSAYASSVELAKERGAFEIFDKDREKDNPFINRLKDADGKLYADMVKYGRRNIACLTIAPTGTTSLMTQTTSGVEPVFMPIYKRRRKINPNDIGSRVDFVDENGDSWEEYVVFHHKFATWMKVNGYSAMKVYSNEELDELVAKSPYYKATANDVDWVQRVKMQSLIQKWVDHSISVTINLPSNVSKAVVGELYMEAWKGGLKGITVYRDGSRSGVLVSNKNSKVAAFEYRDAPKRPKVLKADGHTTVVKGKKFNVIIGLMDGKPYEIFMIPFVKELTNGELVKTKRGVYTYKEDERGVLIDKITNHMSDEQEAMTRILSMSLRHGADIKFAVEQLRKVDGDMFSFTKGIARVLSKYIVNGVESTLSCDSCGSERVIFEEGCSKCLDCGHSACS